jgi:3-phenylpropionate/trans-cinnamate dioxygenase ferredoxin subunit
VAGARPDPEGVGGLRGPGQVAARGRICVGVTASRRVPVAPVEDVPEGTMLMVQVDGTDILLVNRDGLHAMQGICSHEYFELDKGFLTGDSITCALHLSRFDLETGDALDPPAELPLQLYPASVENGQIVLELPETEIPVNQ